MGSGNIVTIDIWDPGGRPKHPRIKYLMGSSISPEIKKKILKLCEGKKKIMVILDSDHSKNHVSQEIAFYSALVTPGCYIIVEDTNVNGNPVNKLHGPGPMEAVKEFMDGAKNFETDKSREKHFVTFNPDGYLLKVT
jgi:cephalosporin hydroxylase